MLNIVTEIDPILQYVKDKKPQIVGIDGIDGVGKTSLAKDIGKLGYTRISLDDYVKNKSGGYFEFIDYDKLQKNILRNSDRFIVIEGILLLKVLEKAHVKLNYLVYVTDNVWIYDWSEEWQGKYSSMSLVEIIKDAENYINKVSKALNPKAPIYKMNGLRKEVFEYAFKYKSWKKAQIILRKI